MSYENYDYITQKNIKMITNEQKLKFADYILNWLKEEELLKDGNDSIDGEQLEETCMAGTVVCEALVEAKIIKDIGY